MVRRSGAVAIDMCIHCGFWMMEINHDETASAVCNGRTNKKNDMLMKAL